MASRSEPPGRQIPCEPQGLQTQIRGILDKSRADLVVRHVRILRACHVVLCPSVLVERHLVVTVRIELCQYVVVGIVDISTIGVVELHMEVEISERKISSERSEEIRKRISYDLPVLRRYLRIIIEVLELHRTRTLGSGFH